MMLMVAVSVTLIPKGARAASAWPPPHRVQHQALPLPFADRGPPPVDAAPPGYHTERRYIAGLLIPGAIITFVGLIPLTVGLSNSAERDDDMRRAEKQGASAVESAARAHELDGTVIAVGLGHMAVGVSLLTLGILLPRHVHVPNKMGLTIVPMLGADRVGGSFTLAF